MYVIEKLEVAASGWPKMRAGAGILLKVEGLGSTTTGMRGTALYKVFPSADSSGVNGIGNIKSIGSLAA